MITLAWQVHIYPSSWLSVLETLSFLSINTQQLLAASLGARSRNAPAKHNHEEGDHNPDACEIRQVPGQGHESGSGGQRGGVRDAGRRRQEPATSNRHGRGLEQAGEEAEEEGGRGGDRGAAHARHVRGGGAPAPGDQAGSGGHGGGAVVAVQRQPPVAVQHLRRRGAHKPVRRLPLLPLAGGRRRGGIRLRLRVRPRQGQQLLAGGGAEPPGQLLAAGGEARLPAHGQQFLLLLFLRQGAAEHGRGARRGSSSTGSDSCVIL